MHYIVPDTVRGSHDAYAVTSSGVYFMADSLAAGATWKNITGVGASNLFNKALTRPIFDDPNQTINTLTSLQSLAVDWRYQIPNSPTDPAVISGSGTVTFSYGATTGNPITINGGTLAATVLANLNAIPGLTGNITVAGPAGGPFTVTALAGKSYSPAQLSVVGGATVTPGASHPVLYAGGQGGVFRSFDQGTTWTYFPDQSIDGAVQEGGFMTSSKVTELSLVLGNLNPATGMPSQPFGRNFLLAATYGQGFYGIRLDDAVTVPGSGFRLPLSKYAFAPVPGPHVVSLTQPGATAISEYASNVISVSSEFLPQNPATDALGAPNNFTYGDDLVGGHSWVPANANGTTETLEVGFATQVFANSVTVRETDGSGFVTKIELVDTGGGLHTVFAGVDPSPLGAIANFSTAFAQTGYLVKGVKITVNTNHNLTAGDPWEEIDSVQLTGIAPPPATLSELQVTFSGPVDPATVSTADINYLTAPDGTPIAVAQGVLDQNSSVTSNAPVYDIVFQTAQTQAGFYSVSLGPNIADYSGNKMDQNQNFVNGEPYTSIDNTGDVFLGRVLIQPANTAPVLNVINTTFQTPTVQAGSPNVNEDTSAWIAGAVEVGNTVTVTTTAPHGFAAGQTVTIAGVGTGYNGTFKILAAPAPTATTFSYTDASVGLLPAGGGTASLVTGTSVASFVADLTPAPGISDATDAAAYAPQAPPVGIAVTSVDDTNGLWQYSVDGGNQWNNMAAAGTPVVITFSPTVTATGSVQFSYNSVNAPLFAFNTNKVSGTTAAQLLANLSAIAALNGGISVTGATGGPFTVTGLPAGSFLPSLLTTVSTFASGAVTVVPNMTASARLLEATSDGTPSSVVTLPGFSGTATFTYNGVAAAAPFAFTAGTNSAALLAVLNTIPALNGNVQVSGGNGGPFTITALANASFFPDLLTVAGPLTMQANSTTNSQIRFVPNPNYSGTATFTYKAWDETSGLAVVTGGDGGTAAVLAAAIRAGSAGANYQVNDILSVSFGAGAGTSPAHSSSNQHRGRRQCHRGHGIVARLIHLVAGQSGQRHGPDDARGQRRPVRPER